MKIGIGKIFHPVDMTMAIAKSIAVLLSFTLGSLLTNHIHEASRLIGAMLATVSSIIVLQSDIKTSFKQGWLRVLGTFIGAIVAYLYLIVFPFNIWGMGIAVFLLGMLCMWLGIPDNGRMATMTLVIILIISKSSPELPPLTNGFLRFSEATIGAVIGIVLAWILEKIKSRRRKYKS